MSLELIVILANWNTTGEKKWKISHFTPSKGTWDLKPFPNHLLMVTITIKVNFHIVFKFNGSFFQDGLSGGLLMW
jgi:hypothetical protein